VINRISALIIIVLCDYMKL